jgi:hypothetical protein
MLAVYAERRLGEIIGGEQGSALVARSDSRLRAEGVCDPARWTRVWVDSTVHF